MADTNPAGTRPRLQTSTYKHSTGPCYVHDEPMPKHRVGRFAKASSERIFKALVEHHHTLWCSVHSSASNVGLTQLVVLTHSKCFCCLWSTFTANVGTNVVCGSLLQMLEQHVALISGALSVPAIPYACQLPLKALSFLTSYL